MSSVTRAARPSFPFRAATVAAVLILSASSAAANDSAEGLRPPSAAEVATLRSLLALQYPTLKQRVSAPASPQAPSVPAVTTEPLQKTIPAIEGDAQTAGARTAG